MRRVDRIRLEKRLRLVLTCGLAFALGALTAGGLIWRADQLAGNDLPAVVDTSQEESASDTADAALAMATPAPAATSGSVASGSSIELLRNRKLEIPVDGVSRDQLRDSFDERRGGGLRRHEAIDIMAPRGTPVRAVEGGRVAKLFRSVQGGLTVYLFDPAERFCYYYAHLDRYAAGLHEGQQVQRGELVGYVGSTGNASADAPHLHFAVFHLGDEPKWWQGTPINPHSVLR